MLITSEHSCPECHIGRIKERKNTQTGQVFYGCSRYYQGCKFACRADRLQERLAQAHSTTPAPLTPQSSTTPTAVAPAGTPFGFISLPVSSGSTVLIRVSAIQWVEETGLGAKVQLAGEHAFDTDKTLAEVESMIAASEVSHVA